MALGVLLTGPPGAGTSSQAPLCSFMGSGILSLLDVHLCCPSSLCVSFLPETPPNPPPGLGLPLRKGCWQHWEGADGTGWPLLSQVATAPVP